MYDALARQLAEHAEISHLVRELLPQVGRLSTQLCTTFARGGHLYTFGNGGSAAAAQHLAAELIGRYKRERRPLPAVALTVDPSVMTCIANDYAYHEVFARQIQALARPGDMVIGFTTSGRSRNVVRGLQAAREVGVLTVVFAASPGGDAASYADQAVLVPPRPTPRHPGDPSAAAASDQRMGRRVGRWRDRRRR